MSGHNKWSQIKRQKGKTDAQKSKNYSKHARLISMESKKTNGNTKSQSLADVIEKAKKENIPKDVIERAIKKGIEHGSSAMEAITYEAYGPGGCALVIEALTENKNKAAQEIKHVLSVLGFSLASIGGATWSFKRVGLDWVPTTTIPLEEVDIELLEKLVESLEDNDEVQSVFTNAE